MTFFGTMEIEGIFFFIIDVVDGNAIGIAVITDDRKDASSAVFEDFLTGIKGRACLKRRMDRITGTISFLDTLYQYITALPLLSSFFEVFRVF